MPHNRDGSGGVWWGDHVGRGLQSLRIVCNGNSRYFSYSWQFLFVLLCLFVFCNKKLSSTCEKFKFRGWYDTAFRLGQENRQILLRFQQSCWASRSKSHSRSQDVSSLALYCRRIPNRMFMSYMQWRIFEEFKFCGWYDAAFCLGQETHQILFEFQQLVEHRAQSPVHEVKMLAVWSSIAEGFPTARSQVICNKKLSSTCEEFKFRY